jgi:hypothetical protein
MANQSLYAVQLFVASQRVVLYLNANAEVTGPETGSSSAPFTSLPNLFSFLSNQTYVNSQLFWIDVQPGVYPIPASEFNIQHHLYLDGKQSAELKLTYVQFLVCLYSLYLLNQKQLQREERWFHCS